MNGLQKLAISWGGRRKDFFPNSPVNPTIGYTNILGLVPFPNIGLRIGSRTGSGITLGTAGVGITGGGVSKSFKQRQALKGLPDVLLEAIEGKPNRLKK
jgi:hypothetical protein